MKNNLGKSSGKASALAMANGTKQRKDRSAVQVVARGPGDLDAATARTLTRPEIGAAAVIEAWQRDTHDVNALAAELALQVQAINAGQLERAEGILISQAHTLDAIFANLMRRAMNQTTMHHWEAYMRMGMKAQSQCRATLQALADLKNPPVFANQANIANGPQQVNNGAAPDFETSTRVHAHAHGKTESEQTKLLEGEQHGGTVLDPRATGTATAGNPAVEAVGAVHRTKDRARQDQG